MEIYDLNSTKEALKKFMREKPTALMEDAYRFLKTKEEAKVYGDYYLMAFVNETKKEVTGKGYPLSEITTCFRVTQDFKKENVRSVKIQNLVKQIYKLGK